MWRLSKIIYHLDLKLLFVYRHTGSFKLWIAKVQDFGNFELSPMVKQCYVMFQIPTSSACRPCAEALFNYEGKDPG